MDETPLLRLKGLPFRTYPSARFALQDARDGAYGWWWHYAQLSPVFWYAREFGRRPVSPKVEYVYKLIGSAQEPDFDSWWMNGGYEVFAETRERPRVCLADLDGYRSRGPRNRSLLVEVPLSIPRHDIRKQFGKLLAEYHPGRNLVSSNQGKALLSLAKVNFRQHALENQYWALVYRLLFPEIIMARIGDRLQFAPHHKIRDHRGEDPRLRYYTRRNEVSGPFEHLMAITGRYLRKAKNALGHLQHGVFPCYAPYVEGEPFGARWQKEFNAMTSCEKGVQSPYQVWLRRKLLKKLKNEVIERNRFQEMLSREDLAFRRAFPDFFAGKSDRTA